MAKKEFLDRNVWRETKQQYLNGWPLGADARRFIYLNYASPPSESSASLPALEEGEKRRDVWEEIASIIVRSTRGGESVRGIDIGASSGYLLRKLLESGYRGEILAGDIQADVLPEVKNLLLKDFPDSNITVGQVDAHKLRKIKVNEAAVPLEIDKNSLDWASALFVLYHMQEPKEAYSSVFRAVKPGGIAVFSGRGPLNQGLLWQLAKDTAEHFDLPTPQSYYAHYPLEQMRYDLEQDTRFNIIYSEEQSSTSEGQREYIYIPDNKDAWEAYKLAIIYSLPSRRTYSDRLVKGEDIISYLDGTRLQSSIPDDSIRQRISQAAQPFGYYRDWVQQGYFVCEVVK